MSKGDRKAKELRKGFQVFSSPIDAPAQNKTPTFEAINKTKPKSQVAVAEWEINGVDDDDITDFYESGCFPEEECIWDAYILGLENHLGESTLPSDFIEAHFNRTAFYPAQIICRYAFDQFEDESTSLTPLIMAMFVWRAIATYPELTRIEGVEDLLTGTVLDICYDLNDYFDDNVSYGYVCEDAQTLIKAMQICTVHEAANKVENWALKKSKKELTQEDIDDLRNLHQKLIVEKSLYPEDDKLDALLDEELKRLDNNLNDGRTVLDKQERLSRFVLIKPQPFKR